MDSKKFIVGAITAILSMGVLFGCATNNDNQEPDPTEEPNEQNQEENVDGGQGRQ
ncbi:hypothetical protein [Oceanobacillus sp. J11TS1]|uniref:hypothetical protein n=1 Tax=Oceanobacillus sp. J11TS1 TaxID=2807191 RepID=UPI001B0BDF70|nr:hypothetical protein [Oceanobacillus sp. J11TS1]GIO24843.1 hypothetical protein J11TS1_34240 [Oceanobacillus sp. J11TS1]